MRVGEAVEALVEYKSVLTYPTVRAVKWRGRRIDLRTTPRIERMGNALVYRFEEGSTRYALRFEVGQQRWYLEGIDDSGVIDWPPPRVFAPPGWRPGERS